MSATVELIPTDRLAAFTSSVALVSTDRLSTITASVAMLSMDDATAFSSVDDLLLTDHLGQIIINWVDIPRVRYADLPFSTRRKRNC